MTDEIQNSVAPESATPSNVVSNEVASSNQESVGSVPETTKQEKMLSQSEVNELIGRVKHETAEKAAEKARREAIRELQKNIASQPVANQQAYYQQPLPNQAQQPVNNNGNLNALPNEYVIQQTMQNLAQQAIDRSIVEDFVKFVADAKKNNPDLDIPDDPRKDPCMANWSLGVVQELTRMDHAEEILKELVDKPSELSMFSVTANIDPARAIRSLKKIESSIKANKAALSQPKAPEPIQPLKPSNTGSDNGSKMSLQDLKKAPWLRG